jgi:trk system potassium uptake protein TrkH
VTLLTVATLVVVGGLGFLTMEEVRLHWASREHKRPHRFSLHSRLVLATTAALILVGWLLYLLFEWRVTLADMPVGDRAVNGLFMSVTARTAGFNAVDYARTTEASSFLTILLMSIGGSPGSTAGGIKTTTFALLWALAWSRLRGIRVAQVSWRSIPEATVQRAVGLSVAAFALVTAAIFGLTVTELGLVAGERPGNDFLVHMFEAVSAFNTVGLSMGATGGLSAAGKWILVVLMFLGRVGPLTFAAALALRRPPGAVRYAYEEVVIG